MEEKKEHESVHEHSHHKKSFTEKVRENPWMLSTLVCGALVLILILSTFFGSFTGNVISANDAGTKVLAFLTGMGYDGLTISSVKEVSGVYEVNLTYEGKTSPIYLTKDGKNIISSLTPIEPASSSDSADTQSTEIPKSDKPIVELYVYTYCPYGLQMEKAMIPVVKLLKDKIDFKIRQIGAMHGDFEKVEAERQLCIEKNYPTKYLDYILAFAEDSSIGDCQGDATCLAPKLNGLYSKLSMDAAKINTCMKSEGEKLYNEEVSNSNRISSQIQAINPQSGLGSPYLIINGQVEEQQPNSRSEEAVKGVLCSAFNNVPSECSQTLSTAQASAGFGSGTSSSSSSASC